MINDVKKKGRGILFYIHQKRNYRQKHLIIFHANIVIGVPDSPFITLYYQKLIVQAESRTPGSRREDRDNGVSTYIRLVKTPEATHQTDR